jgi:hypothetical protein
LAHGSQKRGWLHGNARFRGIPRACVEGALMCVRATFWMQPRNTINGLLAPQGLVRLFAGYQTRPWAVSISAENISSVGLSFFLRTPHSFIQMLAKFIGMFTSLGGCTNYTYLPTGKVEANLARRCTSPFDSLTS